MRRSETAIYTVTNAALYGLLGWLASGRRAGGAVAGAAVGASSILTPFLVSTLGLGQPPADGRVDKTIAFSMAFLGLPGALAVGGWRQATGNVPATKGPDGVLLELPFQGVPIPSA